MEIYREKSLLETEIELIEGNLKDNYLNRKIQDDVRQFRKKVYNLHLQGLRERLA